MKKLIVSLTLFFLALPFCSFSQSTFSRFYYLDNVKAYTGIQIADGGYIFSGTFTDTLTGSETGYIAKTDCEGDFEWAKSFGAAPTINSAGPELIEAPDGNIVCLHNSGSPRRSMMVFKFTPLGTILWATVVGGSQDDIGEGIALHPNGGFVIAGFTESFSSGVGSDAYLFRLDDSGNLIWAKSYGEPSIAEFFSSVAVGSDGSIYTTGRTFYGTFKGILMKTDSLGNPIRTRVLRNSGQTVYGADIRAIGNDHFVVGGFSDVGATNPGPFGAGAMLLEIDDTLDILWSHIYFSPFLQSLGYEVIETSNQNGYVLACNTEDFAFAGFSGRKYLLVRTDPTGSMLQAKYYGPGNDNFPDLHATHDDGYLMTGFTLNNIVYSNFPGFGAANLIKMDSTLDVPCRDCTVTPLMREYVPVFTVVDTIYPVGLGRGLITPLPSFQSLAFQDTIDCAENACVFTSRDEGSTLIEKVVFYPNPIGSGGVLRLKSRGRVGDVSVVDMTGKAIRLEGSWKGAEWTSVELDLRRGVYVVLCDGEALGRLVVR